MKKILRLALILGMVAAGLVCWKWHQANHLRRANVVEFESDMIEGLLRGIFGSALI